MAKALGIDYGTKRTGIAISDATQLIATCLDTIDTHKLDEYICKLINSENIDCFVVGYPVDLKNNNTDVTGHVKGFVKRLKNKYPNKKIYLIDERFTSKMAQKAIIESGIKKRKRREKSLVDKISATIILQDYLNLN
jgi:putative Holliday junction resolvase|tara:strand:+ start:179 stop:589 length:411 start_codon:yes stop_codon:yes gene_type:complete